MKGINFYNDITGEWNSATVQAWMARLPGYGIEWVQDNIIICQHALTSTALYVSGTKSGSDAELTAHVQQMQSLGLHVAWKMFILIEDTPTDWQGNIGTTFTADNWNTWFASLDPQLAHYAALAETLGVELFGVGTELNTPQAQEAHWRAIVATVRTNYSGPIYYAAPFQSYADVAWWDALDYLGTMGWQVLTNKNAPTLDELIAGWSAHRATIQTWALAQGKPLIMSEFGYSSADGTNKEPWFIFSTGTFDPQEQADCYRAYMATWSGVPCVAGHFAWAVFPWTEWPRIDDLSNNPIGRAAGDVLTEYWG